MKQGKGDGSAPEVVCLNLESSCPSPLFSQMNPSHPPQFLGLTLTLVETSGEFGCNPLEPRPSPQECQLGADFLPAPLPTPAFFLDSLAFRSEAHWTPDLSLPQAPGPAVPSILYSRTGTPSPRFGHLWKYSPILPPSTSCWNLHPEGMPPAFPKLPHLI